MRRALTADGTALAVIVIGVLQIVGKTHGKLLRINEWYGLNLPTPKTVFLQLDLFYSCDGTAIVLRTDRDASTRLHLFFDGTTLEKIDVDSARVSSFPQTHRIIGGCREKERKSITLNITSTPGFFELQADGQLFKRRKGVRTDQLEIALPQEAPCCIIKAVLLADGEEVELTTMETTTRTTTTASATSTATTPIAGTTTAQRVTEKKKPPVPTTASHHEYKLYSWTEMVNREWSTTFIICASITCAIMTILVLYGIISCTWLLTKPKEALTLYRVETPVSIF